MGVPVAAAPRRAAHVARHRGRGARPAAAAAAAEGSPVTTREAGPRDSAPLARLLRAVAPADKAQEVSAYAAAAPVAPRAEQRCFLAHVGGGEDAVAGCVGVVLAERLLPKEVPAGDAYVLNLATAPEFRRMGVASALLEAARECAAKAGATGTTVRCEADNDAALALYRREGFVDVPGVAPRDAFRRLMGTLYGAAGVAHAVDLATASALPTAAGAPPFDELDAAGRAAAVVWCALGPAAFAGSRLASRPVVDGLIAAYGAYEVSLAAAVSLGYGAGDTAALAQAVAVQGVVFASYVAVGLMPGADLRTLRKPIV